MSQEYKLSKRGSWRLIVGTILLTMLYIILYEMSVNLFYFLHSRGWVSPNSQSSIEDEARRVAVASAMGEASLSPKHRVAAWLLGIRMGYMSQRLASITLSGKANLEQARAAQEPMLEEARFFARFLQLDTAVVPMESRNIKDLANISARIEADESGLAARIEQRVTVRHRHLYLLGMYVGVEMYRLDLKAGDLLPLSSAPIARHATLAGLPRNVWEPLSKVQRRATPQEVKEAYRRAASAVTEFLMVSKIQVNH